ncbi:hypothetical protein EYC98_02605 [Halieaceae bacterium IMCC14734]|uniref:Uncharacterized protein n=1 Tax=Candidatus Litorirhabdus singularis TaxID=2518993 RepID=A0ABT3TBW0_9GAMM|nr:hypothetical protein [Candidatus Litorirhabdus singularis]MCX2979750.1 hypothetical protein [Candidatus Litorirhabdus singularis]
MKNPNELMSEPYLIERQTGTFYRLIGVSESENPAIGKEIDLAQGMSLEHLFNEQGVRYWHVECIEEGELHMRFYSYESAVERWHALPVIEWERKARHMEACIAKKPSEERRHELWQHYGLNSEVSDGFTDPCDGVPF